MFLIKDIPESKGEQSGSSKFDYAGFVVFILVMVALNVVITRGGDFGWTSPISLTLMAVTVVGGALFLKIVTRKSNGFIDISLFKNNYFTEATISNFFTKCCSWCNYCCKYVCPSGKRLLLFSIWVIIAWQFSLHISNDSCG